MSDAISLSPDPDKIELGIPAIMLRQPIGDLYVGSVPSSLLVRITDFDVRRKIEEERDVERYLGIQRPLDPVRVKELSRYVNFADATFPSACILAVDEEYADFDLERGVLSVRNFALGEGVPSRNIRYIARVLDGQHRIAGLRDYSGEQFNVPTVFFVGADLPEQATVFSTVNLEQSKVSRSLAYDLYALARTRSPQRLGHEVAVAFDADVSSPFYKRIKRLGVATAGRYGETLAQAQFVEGLITLVSKDEKLDRDILLRGKQLPRPDASQLKRQIFRGLFVDGKDLEIARSLDAYFRAVRDRWPSAWQALGGGAVLGKTNGFRALIRFARSSYNYLYGPNQTIKYPDIEKLFGRSSLRDEDFNVDRYPPGSSGEGALFRDLLETCRVPAQ